MSLDVLMPNLGFDTQTGRLLEWLKQPGDPVAKGEALAVIESDKANVELEAIAGGIMLEHHARPEQEVTVGAMIARIGTADEYRALRPISLHGANPAGEPTARVSPIAQRLARDLQVPVGQISGSGGRGRVTRRDVEAFQMDAAVPPAPSNGTDRRGIKALPHVRRAARERGIDLAALLAAGYSNPLTLAMLDDYPAAGSAPPTSPMILPPSPMTAMPAGATRITLSRMRQTIGKRLSDSMREAPHFYVTGEFIFDAAVSKLKSSPGTAKINDLISYLTTQTLLRVPALNATYHEGALDRYTAVHLALAVAREDGLITPVVHNAERFSLSGLTAEARIVIDRARANRLNADDLQGGTFTISNMGMIAQVEHFTAVINPPQVAILAVGALKARAVVIDGGLFVRQTAHLTLSGDHRVVDGMDLARFMAVFQEELDRFSA